MVPDIKEHVVVRKRVYNATGPESSDWTIIDQLPRATNEEVYGKTTDSPAIYRWTQEVASGLTDFKDVPDELKTAVRLKLVSNYIRYASADIPYEETDHDQ